LSFYVEKGNILIGVIFVKRVIKYFSLVLFCSLFMLLSSFSSVDAIYDSTKNVARVSVNKNEVKITVTYQRGFDISEKTVYMWCEKTSIDALPNPINCTAEEGEVPYFQLGKGAEASNLPQNYISQANAAHADSNLISHTFTVNKSDDELLKSMESGKYYDLVVMHYFCAVRQKSADGNSYPSCEYWDPTNIYTVISVTSNDILNNKTVGSIDLSGSIDDIGDDDVETLMKQITDIVNNTVLPITWVALGLFLVVKGSLLGVQIVKAADEPQVRQEKIGSLKWMVIGVAISYGASFVVGILLNFFSGAFGE
jgi:hypothetical protein